MLYPLLPNEPNNQVQINGGGDRAENPIGDSRQWRHFQPVPVSLTNRHIQFTKEHQPPLTSKLPMEMTLNWRHQKRAVTVRVFCYDSHNTLGTV